MPDSSKEISGLGNTAGECLRGAGAKTAAPPQVLTSARPNTFGLVVALAFLTGVVLLVLFLFNPARHGFYPFCVFYKTTGLLCPGCGSLRALHHLLHGDLLGALRLNALFVLALPFAGWFGLRLMREALGRPVTNLNIRPAWVWGAFALLVVFSVARNLI